jgi:predicted DNA-binding transcriptional regulator YafY
MPHLNVVRRVQLYKMLKSGRAYAIDELAALLGVKARTIHRDLAALQRGNERIEIFEADGQGPFRPETSVLEPRGIRG